MPTPPSFLEKIADYIVNFYATRENKLCVVLPNRRAGLFLKKHIGEKISAPVWVPSCLSIEDFMVQCSGLQLADTIILLVELYEAYKEVAGKTARPFDDFCGWGTTLLNDFNEIDQYLVDQKSIFSYLGDAKALELWNPDGAPLTDFQKQYLGFWKSLGPCYEKFTRNLVQKKLAYQGMIYKMVSESSARMDFLQKSGNWDAILFAGFNALTPSEERVITNLINRGKAQIFWDTDKYYTGKGMHEAGYFIRKHTKNPHFKSTGKDFQWVSDRFSSDGKNISVCGVAGNINQVKYAGQLLQELRNEEMNPDDIAVVLADETLLLPALNSLPEKINDVNITMGFPLRASPLHDLWDSIFRLHENAYTTSPSDPCFYHKDITAVFLHPFIFKLPGAYTACLHISKQITERNYIYVSQAEIQYMLPDDVKTGLAPLLSVFTNLRNNPSALIQHCITLAGAMLSGNTPNKRESSNPIEDEQLVRHILLFNQLKEVLATYNVFTGIANFRRIFNRLSAQISIPFHGEPLRGLQIMGMLETRALDFETVVLLSCNENILPSGSSSSSFIPYDIRKSFGLLSSTERDAIYSYHFYRLLQRAKRIFLIYNTEPSDFGNSEKSRFVTQLEYELPAYNPTLKLSSKIISTLVVRRKEDIKSIEKTDNVLQAIDALAKGKGFSPTSLNAFLKCPLDFYFRYVACMQETSETEDSVDAALMGELIHKILEDLYLPFSGKLISTADSAGLLANAEACTKEVFLSHFREKELYSGKNLLALKVAVRYVLNFLRKEKEFIENTGQLPEILHLEKKMKTEFDMDASGTVHFKGLADRIDRIGTQLRIIDYKTSGIKSNELKAFSANIVSGELNPYSFQLLMYGWLSLRSGLYASVGGISLITPAIVSLRRSGEGLMFLKTDCELCPGSPAIQLFEELLVKITRDIYNKNIPFSHKHTAENCLFCHWFERR